MQLKLFAVSFLTILLAEMGDKTQLTIMTLAVQHKARFWVLAGSLLALFISSALAVLCGEMLLAVLPIAWLHRGAGVIFIVLGLSYLLYL